MKSQGTVTEQIDDKVAYITFSHPQGNSLPKSLLSTLHKTIEKLGQDKSIEVLVLQSIGSVFCAGASFDELSEVGSLSEATEFFMGFGNVILSIKNANQLVIAKVHGKTVGGGLGIIGACDWVCASDEASVKLSELSIGLGAFTISSALVRKIGVAKFSELSLSTQWRDAAWCYNAGLFCEISTADKLEETLSQRVKSFLKFNKNATLEQKKLLWSMYDITEDELLIKAKTVSTLLLSENNQNYIKSLKKPT